MSASTSTTNRPLDGRVALVTGWLCGPDAAFVSGATLAVDGGLLAGMAPYAHPHDRAEESP